MDTDLDTATDPNPLPVVLEDPNAGVLRVEGFCPYLFCTKPSPHEHHVCGVCEAVRYGNINCPTCQAMAAKLGDDR